VEEPHGYGNDEKDERDHRSGEHDPSVDLEKPYFIQDLRYEDEKAKRDETFEIERIRARLCGGIKRSLICFLAVHVKKLLPRRGKKIQQHNIIHAQT